ncbi:MAG: YabP/YqfC family sporulation protein [Lawsonibacter sp.]
MSGKGIREGLLERTAELLDLPADAVAGVPRLELVGTRELRMENHKGILAYGTEEIHISGGSYIVKVTGEALELRASDRAGAAHHRAHHRRSAGIGAAG